MLKFNKLRLNLYTLTDNNPGASLELTSKRFLEQILESNPDFKLDNDKEGSVKVRINKGYSFDLCVITDLMLEGTPGKNYAVQVSNGSVPRQKMSEIWEQYNSRR